MSPPNRFRVLHTPISLQPGNVDTVVMAACVLHNLLRIRKPTTMEGDYEDRATHEMNPGSWRVGRQLASITQTRISGRSTLQARDQRDYLKDYFNSPKGSVPWQLRMI